MHLLRLLRRACPVDAIVETRIFSTTASSAAISTTRKPMLLAGGDHEAQIAADRQVPTPSAGQEGDEHGFQDRFLSFRIPGLCGLRVITARNPVHAALYLMPAFFRPGGVWLLLAEFLAIALVLVYVGAVMVLFLFVVMMLDINRPHPPGFLELPAAGRHVGLIMVAELGAVIAPATPAS